MIFIFQDCFYHHQRIQSAFAILLLLALHIPGLNLHVAWPFGSVSLDQPFLDGFPNCTEYFGDVVVILGAALDEGHSILVGKSSSLIEAHLSFCFFAIDLVADDDLAH